jgi:hypothetical protein
MAEHPCPASLIRLSQQEAQRLPVDLIVYPEDAYLVVDPYAEMCQAIDSWLKVALDAQHRLPRPLGEVSLCRPASLAARYVLRMVVLDFESLPAVRTEVLETALLEAFRQGVRLGVQSLCLDRFELLESSLSAYKLLKLVVRCWNKVFSNAMGREPEAIVVTLTPGPCWRRFEMALAHLRRV